MPTNFDVDGSNRASSQPMASIDATFEGRTVPIVSHDEPENPRMTASRRVMSMGNNDASEAAIVHPPELTPEDFSDDVPEIRYRIDWIKSSSRDSDDPDLKGWFMKDEPFSIQVTQISEEDQEKKQPIFEVITQIKGITKHRMIKFEFPQGTDVKTDNRPDTDRAPSPARNLRKGRKDTDRDSYTSMDSDDESDRKFTFFGDNEEIPLTRLQDVDIHEVVKTGIVIYSPHILRTIRQFVEYYPNLKWNSTGLYIDAPYRFLMHYVDRLCDYAASLNTTPQNQQSDEQRGTRRHLELLLKFVEPHREKVTKVIRPKLRADPAHLEFDDLWYIFKPGTEVYVEPRGDEPLLCAVVESFYYKDTKDVEDDDYNGRRRRRRRRRGHANVRFDPKGARLKVWYLVSNGTEVGRASRKLGISSYQGEKDVTSLEVYPSEYYDAKDRIEGKKRKQNLEKQGARLYKFCRDRSTEMVYQGPTVRRSVTSPPDDSSDSSDSDTGTQTRRFRGKVIVDLVTAIDTGGIGSVFDPDHRRDDNLPRVGDAKPEFRYKAYDDILVAKVDQLQPEQYRLLFPVVAGFSLKSKEWMSMFMTGLQESTRESKVTQTLIIDPSYLEVIKALSLQRPASETAWSADFIEGKGMGQVVLLHGPPGVGKTYTVECIAEEFKRPLLPLTVADIGTDERELEKELSKWFTLAETWNAVLLIDEADIFLERRRNSDLARNGLVTVFLRQMEYFSGLLFVTTNRVGQIDDAFVSRVHVKVEYKPLDGKGRQDIWRSFLGKLQNEKRGSIVITRGAEQYILNNKTVNERDWNGRDIRNALHTAIALATYEETTTPRYGQSGPSPSSAASPPQQVIVEERHFQQVVSMSQQFQNYLDNVAQATMEERAAGFKDRANPRLLSRD